MATHASAPVKSTTVERAAESAHVTMSTMQATAFSVPRGAVRLKVSSIERAVFVLHWHQGVWLSPRCCVHGTRGTKMMLEMIVEEKRRTENTPRRIKSPPKRAVEG